MSREEMMAANTQGAGVERMNAKGSRAAMYLFCFASKNVENIKRGIAAKMWAVSKKSGPTMRGRATKARRYFTPGVRGLLYCRETHSFTVPFLATSAADPHAVIADIWPEPWVLPFSIEPLGDLSRQIKGDLAKELWPILKDCGVGGVTAAMNVTGVTVFVPLQIADSDWGLILDSLATRPPQSN
jgi:hypothetical protein